MTITIPTADLVGILKDTIPFAHPDQEVPGYHCVRLEWDGELLHAQTVDGTRLAWSTWGPDDDPDDERQDSMFAQPGGDDPPWSVNLLPADAAEIVKTFRLPGKHAGVPLVVAISPTGSRLTITRGRDTGHTEHTMTVQPLDGVSFPDVRGLLGQADTLVDVKEVRHSGRLLADFGAKVRQRDVMRLRFTERLTLVEIGTRFVGAIAVTPESQRLGVAA